MFLEAGVGSPHEIEQARKDGGLGVFVRSLVGVDRAAGTKAIEGFIKGRTLTANQHEFLDVVVEHLTARGVMDPRLLYHSPFTDFGPLGVAGVFTEPEVHDLVEALRVVERRAAA